jgi:hypothetical protein
VAIDPLRDRQDIIHVTPIHTHEVDRSIARDLRAGAERFGKIEFESVIAGLV